VLIQERFGQNLTYAQIRAFARRILAAKNDITLLGKR
jgi:hypothetical protein